ncbi:NifU family protein [Rickettsiales endosymbiont of Trichoplax sp. H2]|uniref:NifU family protein n=1 Tax=Rickettsiales endosymbiont of Trichoplax sp. H2 TaxID=2021221 RepID=UPI0012B1B7DD|nr:NifU family protein [Rickettsiales endosymbiont of Trichoplax sp. H2]MSO14038.1 NFU1 iron-sulfur cluster scaffold-like protein, mitochondrial [Rickettsiales endosymbiont of Trichoplax sp. H2]
MYIQTQDTPNPNTLKFIPGIEVLKNGSKQFNKHDNCTDSLLAQQLFKIDGVDSIFFGNDFISVTKENKVDWEIIKTFILSKLVDHFLAGLPVITQSQDKKKIIKANSKIEEQIIELLNSKIRPAVAQDGGDIIYNKFENGVVYLELHGACKGCPSSTITLKQGIENMLKHYIPEIKSVESI